MKTSIRKAAKPAKLSASAKTLFADAIALDFKHLGWLKTSGGEPITIAGFADMDGGIALVLAGASKGVFEPLAVDFFSHLDKQRKLTTTTFSLVIPQESRGIYKYSHPGLKLVSLLRKHRQYMRGLKATPVVHTKSLTDLAKSISDYLAYENQEHTESKKSADATLSP